MSEKNSSSMKKEKAYRTEKLLGSSHLAGYQPDFARAVLKEPEYTIKGAKQALDKALKGGN